MGQLVSVVKQSTAKNGIIRYETNRSLTGSGHETYVAGREIVSDRAPDELAKRLFAMGDGQQVQAIHIFSNIVTVELAPHGSADGIETLIRDLYTHYLPGVTPSL
jgi:hypothetical protein